MVKALQERVSVSVDKKTLVITASVQMQDPVISAQMTKVVLENLQNYITNYRTQKVKQDLEFTQKVFGESRDAYYKAQRLCCKGGFRDRLCTEVERFDG